MPFILLVYIPCIRNKNIIINESMSQWLLQHGYWGEIWSAEVQLYFMIHLANVCQVLWIILLYNRCLSIKMGRKEPGSSPLNTFYHGVWSVKFMMAVLKHVLYLFCWSNVEVFCKGTPKNLRIPAARSDEQNPDQLGSNQAQHLESITDVIRATK